MTDEIKFPLLKASDIDVRIDDLREMNYNNSSYVKCRLLLYKNARVDMKYLDAMFGPMNWQRKHTLINNELFCSIEVWGPRQKMLGLQGRRRRSVQLSGRKRPCV